MDIVVYKPKKFVDFYNPAKSDNYGEEVYMMAKMLYEYDDNLYIGVLSKNNIIKNINNGIVDISSLLENDKKEKADYLIMITGYLSQNEEAKVLDIINAKKKILFVTDLFCVKEYNLHNYDIIVTPTKPSYFSVKKNVRFFNISNLRSKFLFDNFKPKKVPYIDRLRKGIYIGHDYFVDKFKEYVVRPNIKFYGKAKSFNIYNPIKNSKVLSTLSKYLYSPIFYNNTCMVAGLVTARLVELAIAGVVPIIDYTYYPYNNQHKLYNNLMCKDYESFIEIANKIDYDFYNFVIDKHKITIENELSNLNSKLYNVLFS